ncbi:Uncharacterised protein [Campylobacter hyointestinalis subsp. hyointestinalis]|uniref:Uncharacterized protein n=1 Tax=Campylobacter hyointestinalis subsp. hyointestinalis TaxID=91352 RepID=A0A9W5EYI3_CAMHY|nr:hypothetical protein [Campylobacter hyointestinalis]CUU79213.1 Uncharacterised protein [Campylobacter hyointestinalis subsp. hyointestinalis]CUU83264.1 Uncharacterised protein [Campylobacter hyointestinalis subsp. hyointestinalis]CUU88653.1 Uncharacterised protein [Campylobacter hyointestinalis subsp. hyointestinalis]
MFKKLILSGAVASLLATGAMAEGYTTDIYTSIGSQGSYEFGLAMDHKNNISSSWSYKNIADKDLYKGAIYAANKINYVYWGVGAGVIHSKMNETKTSSYDECTALGCNTITTSSTTTNKETKPTINGIATGKLPYLGAGKIESYLADAHNLGATIEFNVWSGQSLFSDILKFGGGDSSGGIPFVTVGVGADKIQGETEKSVFVKLHYAF